MKTATILQSGRRFLHTSFPETSKRDLIIWIVIAIFFAAIGSLIAYFSFREAFGVGDISTFFRFSHNLFSGEAIYKDFIHFRTPGSYFNEALFIKLFGDQISSVVFAVQFEAHAMYTFVFAIGLAIFLKFKKALLGFVILVPVLLLPAYLQLRTALAFLAISLYIQSKRNDDYRHIWLLLSGIVAGWAFIFGQEAGVMVAMAAFVTELCLWNKAQWKAQLKNVLVLIGGAFIGVLPLLIYLFSVSDIHNFVYYTLYYAFVLQPKGMDLPYPIFSHETIIYYLVPALIVLAFYIFYSSKKATLPYAILLAFSIARLVTLFGRSDMGHLIFVLPEIFLLSILAFIAIPKADFNLRQFKRFLPYVAVLIMSFIFAKQYSSGFVVLGALAVMLAFRFRSSLREAPKVKTANLVVLVLMSATLAIFLFTIAPSLNQTIRGMSKRGVTAQSIGGVNTDPDTYYQVTAVGNAVKKHNPTTMFSYPIQAYYYTYAPKHAARFITFEPQTTLAEQDETISDLKRTKPEVVVFDPLQAASLSKSLWKINNYIMSHYAISEKVVSKEILWIMVPRADAETQINYLALTLHKDGLNSETSQLAQDIQSSEKGLNNGVMQGPKSDLDFKPDKTTSPKTLAIAVYFNEVQPTANCGDVRLHYAKQIVNTHLCAKDGRITIPLQSNLDTVELVNTDTTPLVWNEPALSN